MSTNTEMNRLRFKIVDFHVVIRQARGNIYYLINTLFQSEFKNLYETLFFKYFTSNLPNS